MPLNKKYENLSGGQVFGLLLPYLLTCLPFVALGFFGEYQVIRTVFHPMNLIFIFPFLFVVGLIIGKKFLNA